MEDWERKLFTLVRHYVIQNDPVGHARHEELRDWLNNHDLNKIIDIKSAQHAVELMELIDRWHDEDVAKQPCAAPAPPANPFIVEQLERRIRIETIDDITINDVTKAEIDIEVKADRYRPKDLRSLAKQLSDLADAHEAVYPPQQPNPDDL